MVVVQELSKSNNNKIGQYIMRIFLLTDEMDLLMSDEAHFNLSDTVNKPIFRYSSDLNPQLLKMYRLRNPHCGMTCFRIIGLYFFEEGRAKW